MTRCLIRGLSNEIPPPCKHNNTTRARWWHTDSASTHTRWGTPSGIWWCSSGKFPLILAKPRFISPVGLLLLQVGVQVLWRQILVQHGPAHKNTNISFPNDSEGCQSFHPAVYVRLNIWCIGYDNSKCIKVKNAKSKGGCDQWWKYGPGNQWVH